jgi:NADPH:quinone reductase-like Zn-dependent oxidoreductase
VRAFKVGDRVTIMSTIACGRCDECRRGAGASCGESRTIGVHRWGGYAEFVAVPASNAALIPAGLGFNEATVIARHGSAAYNFLIDRGKLRHGETALIFGASGALGSFAVQIAKLFGATVVAVAGTNSRVAFARQMGADAAINHSTGDLVAQVMALTNNRGAELVFESSGDPHLWALALRCVAQTGRLVSCGAHAGGNVQLDLKRLYVGRLQIIGAAGVNVSDLDWALAAGARSNIRATIDRIYPLEHAAEAHDYVERMRPVGKVLIAPG